MKRLICCLLCAVVIAGCGAKSSIAVSQAEAEQSSETSQTHSIEPEQESAPTEESPAPALTESSEAGRQESESEAARGIPGSHYTDVALNLEQNFGFPKHETKRSDLMDCQYVPTLTVTDPQTQTQYDYTVYYAKASDPDSGTIISAEFDVLNTGAIDNDSFYKLADLYLGFCATIPYSTAESSGAKQWVQDNLKPATEGDEATKRFGDAQYNLYGTKLDNRLIGQITLNIKKYTSDGEYQMTEKEAAALARLEESTKK